MTNKRKLRLIIGTIGFTTLLMAFTSFGSFNPINVGFWACVLGGVIWFSIMNYLFQKYAESNKE